MEFLDRLEERRFKLSIHLGHLESHTSLFHNGFHKFSGSVNIDHLELVECVEHLDYVDPLEHVEHLQLVKLVRLHRTFIIAFLEHISILFEIGDLKMFENGIGKGITLLVVD